MFRDIPPVEAEIQVYCSSNKVPIIIYRSQPNRQCWNSMCVKCAIWIFRKIPPMETETQMLDPWKGDPKRRQLNTNLHPLTSQRNEDLMYTAAVTWNHACLLCVLQHCVVPREKCGTHPLLFVQYPSFCRPWWLWLLSLRFHGSSLCQYLHVIK